MVRVRVLGTLEATVDVDGRDVVADLGGPRQRAVLALLLVGRGEVVSVDRLVEDLWNSEPPPRAIGALQAYVSHLRRALEPDRQPRAPATVLVSEPPGYAVRLPVDAVDAWRFEAMVRSAATADDPEHTRSTLEQALALWRGPAYAEVAGEPWAVAEAARLEGLRLVARERWCAAVLRTGAAADAVLAAEMLTREHPLREEGWRLLALALYASGRQSDALAALRRAREILAEEMGLDPGPALVQLESAVLNQQLTIEPPPQRPPQGAPSAPGQTADPARSVAPKGSVRTSANPAAGDEATPGTTAAQVTTTITRTPADPHAIDLTPPGRAARPVVGGEFVGRDAELNALHAAAGDAADRSALRVALLAGDPGAGKTTILDRLIGDLVQLGWRVAVGRCPEAAGAPPAWAWVETLRSLTADVDPGPLAPALAPLLDERLAAAQQSDASFGRFLLQRAVSSYLTTAAIHRPLAVVLDDLHRGDSETLALLGGLADTVTGVPLLLIGSYRPSEVNGELRDTLAGLARHSPVRLLLGGLEPDQAARLIRTVAGVQPDEATLAAITDRTGGNPFYLVESARLLGSEGTLVATSRVPEGVRDVLRRRLARLPEVSVSVLRLAAVIGRDVDVDVLVQAAEVDEEAVIDALEVGVLAGLLTEPAPGAVRFAHVLVRDTLYGDVPRVRLSRWHARVAAALTSVQPGDAAALAYHYHQAGTSATARQAVDAGVLAAEQAVARYAHDAAVQMYAQALVDLDRVPPPAPDDAAGDAAGVERLLTERVRLLARLSRSQLTAGAGVDALTSRGRALLLADDAGRDDLVVRVLTAWDLPTPWLNRQYGSIDAGVTALIERCLRADNHADNHADATRCRLLCALVSEISGEDHDRSLAAATEAESLARRAADPVLIGLSLHALSAVVLADLEPDRRQRIAQELIEIGGRPGLAVFALIGHLGAAQVAGARVDLDGAREQTELARVLVERYRWRQSRGIVAMNRGMLAHIAGDLDAAEQLYSQGGELIRQSGAVDADGIIAVAWMTMRITQGRVGELESTIRDTGSAADVERDLLAMSLAAQGRVAEARELRRRIRPVRRDFFRSLFLTMRAMTVTALAERSEAASVYEELLDYEGQIGGAGGSAFALGPVDTALGDLALLLGRREAAAAHYAAGLELARRCGSAPWTAIARDKLAQLSVSS